MRCCLTSRPSTLMTPSLPAMMSVSVSPSNLTSVSALTLASMLVSKSAPPS